MTKKNTGWFRLVALLLAVSLCFGLASCGKKQQEENPAPSVGTEKRTYTVTLKTEGGKALADVGVYFYTDSTLAELVWFAKTDADGKASFTDLESNGYVAVLSEVPDGYKVEPYYLLTALEVEIVLPTNMSDVDLADLNYKLGDVMMNFTVTDVNGKTWVLADLLAEKKAVVLNFWYLQCAPCKMEFPYLQEAYEKYSDKIALLALNPINDSREEIAAYAVENGLTFPMAHCDPGWEKAMGITAYPTTVIIDRFGTIALIHKGGIDDSKTFEDAFEYFTSDEYKQSTVEDIKSLEIKATGSDSSNPIEIGSQLTFEVTVDPGQKVYYNIYRVDGFTLQVNNRYIYAEYDGRTIQPKEGTLEFTLHCPDTYTPASVVFGNSGEETQTFTVRLTAKPGTIDNPIAVKLGDFAVSSAAGNDKGVVYTYTPQADGTLTVQCNSVTPAGLTYKLSMNTQTASGGTKQENIETNLLGEEAALSITVRKGVKVQITVSACADSSNNIPAASFKCTLLFEEGTAAEDAEALVYAVTFTDQYAVPVKNVKLKVTEVTTGEEETSSSTGRDLTTNEYGVAHDKTMKAGTYEVSIVSLPAGYDVNTNKFLLTEERPVVSIMLTEVIIEYKTYTFLVKDEAGNPVSGAMVSVGQTSGVTDASGTVKLELVKKDQSVNVIPPADSPLSPKSQDFAAEEDVVEIILTEGSSEEPGTPVEKLEYTVTVVDYDGNPQSGVYVQFMRGSAISAAPQTGADGVAKASLASADYTVVLTGTSLHYEPKKAVLPKGTTELTIKLAPAIAGQPEEYWFGTIRYLQLGGNYATLQANSTNYFVFEPTRAGQYRLSTSDPAAILSYQGGSLYYVTDMTSSTDYNPRTNSFTRNWKESNIGGVIVIGVTGAEDAIIEVTRIGDPVLDETDMTVEVYKAKKAPTASAGKITAAQGKKLTYVDLSGKTSDYQIVLGSDGYYHLNKANGPRLYMNIGPNAPFHSLYYMAGAGGNGVAGTGIKATVYDDNGVAIKRWDFSECMLSYGECADPTYGVYPLTEDLVFIVQTAGEYYGWWDSSSSSFWLDTVENLNPELGWMFAVCYVP